MLKADDEQDEDKVDEEATKKRVQINGDDPDSDAIAVAAPSTSIVATTTDAASAAPATATESGKPKKWREALTADGRTYYYCDGVVKWQVRDGGGVKAVWVCDPTCGAARRGRSTQDEATGAAESRRYALAQGGVAAGRGLLLQQGTQQGVDDQARRVRRRLKERINQQTMSAGRRERSDAATTTTAVTTSGAGAHVTLSPPMTFSHFLDGTMRIVAPKSVDFEPCRRELVFRVGSKILAVSAKYERCFPLRFSLSFAVGVLVCVRLRGSGVRCLIRCFGRFVTTNEKKVDSKRRASDRH